MPADQFAEHLRRRRQSPRPDPLQEVPAREPARLTSDLAAALLAEAVSRPLESGELLLVSEEASLSALEEAAAAIPSAVAPPPLSAELSEISTRAPVASPRLLSLRIWEAFTWQPSLAEHLRLLADLLRGGERLPLAMLIGHLETFPERVEHLTRLRALVAGVGAGGGSVIVSVRQADADDLAALADAAGAQAAGRLQTILAGARPRRADEDRRHALAVARLALGAGAVLTD